MKKRALIASGIALLNPVDCGSTIGYSIVRSRYLSGEVDLTDCDRKIHWYFSDKADIRKIDKAIEVLSNFRTDFVLALRKKKKRK